MITDKELDDVEERLTEHDDDIVLSVNIRNHNEIAFYSRELMAKNSYSTKRLRNDIATGEAIVIRSFVDLDGTRYYPK